MVFCKFYSKFKGTTTTKLINKKYRCCNLDLLVVAFSTSLTSFYSIFIIDFFTYFIILTFFASILIILTFLVPFLFEIWPFTTLAPCWIHIVLLIHFVTLTSFQRWTFSRPNFFLTTILTFSLQLWPDFLSSWIWF